MVSYIPIVKSASSNGLNSKEKSKMTPPQSSKLMKLFEDELQDIYWAEKALTNAMPKMINNSASPELVDALTSHHSETDIQISRMEKVFLLINKKAFSKNAKRWKV